MQHWPDIVKIASHVFMFFQVGGYYGFFDLNVVRFSEKLLRGTINTICFRYKFLGLYY